jgi:hypothetical protein
MPERPKFPAPRPDADLILEEPETSVLDLLDRLLNKGVVLSGDITLGVAGVDLIYLRLSSILCAVDRLFPPDPDQRQRRRKKAHATPAGRRPSSRRSRVSGRR